ncbi:DNA cytosine methyltransferase [Notoacmeibacter sp. MSK16QG-6]|uniref:DNA cytosine methyltransferase n=1 Tax=Notoacmeibacter sp. MSK16QG-6 TaxID=2957982 RepID=UPI0020A08F4E|nr:DNA cytosine methyltransferase [Notoacmeibacter sp. MSK16QG-6]MCP1200076.1 DNA cytosine methyltransferase [Notoacmeibacter sp. MSK16QG-6]
MAGAPLIIDSFAGGGGASTGIEMALGRSPDIAINHDADALAMHMVNHPSTLHLSKNIWHVDPIDHLAGRHVGLAWFSPDCKHFSKAKGGKPVERNVRDLAWIIPGWIERIQKSGGKVDVVILENVEEFKDWGPLRETPRGLMPCPDRRGRTFEKWRRTMRRLGGRIELRELRACDYGAPTIRKRLFVIIRFDGQPIVWPEPTHGPPDDPDVVSGRKKPWRTAAEIIDWSLPCPSIFDTSEEIKEKYGVRAIRPLAAATMKRIARGIVRYVLEAKKPFVVTYGQLGGGNRAPDAPLHTVTASPKDQNAIFVPHLTKFQTGSTGSGIDEPAPTVTANSYIKKPGGAAPIGIVAAHLSRFTQNGVGHGADEPLDTVMAGAPKFGLVAAFLAQHNNDGRRAGGVHPGRPAGEPMATVTATGSQQAVVAAHIQNIRGSDRRDAPANAPLQTLSAQGTHAALVAGFLTKYYGEGFPNQAMDEPVHTLTTLPRHGLVTVEIAQNDGSMATYAIADIGMRMLTPRERFRAQGFPDDYIIDRRPDGTAITATVQGRCCGNSVCPPLAAALVAANCGYLAAQPAMEAAE